MVFDQEGEMNLLFIRMLAHEIASSPGMVGPSIARPDVGTGFLPSVPVGSDI